MATYVVNTDAAHGAVNADEQWIRRSIAVTSGDLSYKEKLENLKVGDKIALYVKALGITAVGTVIGDEVKTVYGTECVNPAEPFEYHRQVRWHFDLRNMHISCRQANAMGIYSLSAVHAVKKGEAELLNWLTKIKSQPTADKQECDRRARALLSSGWVSRPKGTPTPTRVQGNFSSFYRAPAVRAWTLQRAGAQCECCNERAPFVDQEGVPYLESHHIQSIAEGGEDTPENTAAVCPNCHRELHYGIERDLRTRQLKEKVLFKEAKYLGSAIR